MSNRNDLTELVSLALREKAADAIVTPASQAERRFWNERRPRSRRRRALVAIPVAAALVAGIVAVGWLVGGRDDAPRRPEPSGQVGRVSTRVLSASAADATSHMIGNGAVVGDGVWFVLGGRLVTTDAAGRRVSQERLAPGTDGEALCCVEQVGGVVLVPTARGYEHRDASTREVLALTPSRIPGPVATAGDNVWLRTGLKEISLVEPATGRVVRRVATPRPADLLAVGGDTVFVASRSKFVAFRSKTEVALLDQVSGKVTRTVDLPSWPLEAMESAGGHVFVADATGRLADLDPRSGKVTRQWRVDDRSVGPRPRLMVADDSLWWGSDAGTVVRLDPATGDVLDAVTVNLESLWDNGDQQRNGLYVTPDGVWIPTRNDTDDYEFHRLPLTLGQP